MRVNRFKAMVVLGSGICMVASAASPAHSMQPDDPRMQEFRRLQLEAQQARKDAEDALKRAKDAEIAINALLVAPPASALAAGPDCSDMPKTVIDEPKAGEKRRLPQRVECFVKGPTGAKKEVSIRTPGLMAYAVDYSNEKDLLTFLKNREGKKVVNFMQVAQPVASRLTISKGAEAFEGSYTYPLSRTRAFSDDHTMVRAITSSLTVGFSALIDPKDKTTGLLLRDGSFNDDTAGISISFGRQYYPATPVYGERGSIEAQAKAFGHALWDQCSKDLKAVADIYGKVAGKPDKSADPDRAECEGLNLLAWSFDSDREATKANIAAYNAAFWNPGKDAVPEYGWGLTLGLSTKKFKYIDPSAFAPGIVLNAVSPRLLATLSTQDPKDGGPFINELSPRHLTKEFGGYVFRHFPGPLGPLDGLLARLDLTITRRWEFKTTEKDQEFCRFKKVVPEIGECVKFNIGAPNNYWAFEPSFNLRTQLKFGDAFPRIGRFVPSLAISPRISWNEHSDAYRLEVPVYLSGNDTSKELTGGIRYTRTWNDKIDTTNNVGVWSVFLSTPFTMNGSKK